MMQGLRSIFQKYVPAHRIGRYLWLTCVLMFVILGLGMAIQIHQNWQTQLESSKLRLIRNAEMVLQHHERMDGSGYPQGLKGDHILMGARIIAIADVVEAMSTNRPYRFALGLPAALQEIQQGRGTLYDAEAVDACLDLFEQQGFSFH